MILRHWRWGRWACLGGTVAAGLWLGWTATGGLPAQTPGLVEPAPQDAAPSQRIYMNRPIIDLPIKMDDAQRALIQEIHLYVKESPTAPWVFRDKGGAGQQAFRFQAPRDGEFRFTMVTVDKQGRRFPQDLANEPPGLTVMIDTQKPVVQMKKLADTSEGQLVHCEVSDANLDNANVRFYFQSGDKVFRPLDPVAGQPGVFCVPRQAVTTGVVRLVANDLAGNQTVCEEHVNQMQARASAASLQPTAFNPTPPKGMSELDAPKPLPTVLGSVEIEPNPSRPAHRPTLIETPSKAGTQRPDGSEGPRFSEDSGDTTKPGTERNDLAWITKNATAAEGPRLSMETEPSVKAATTEVPHGKRQVVNNSTLFLDFQVENGKPAVKVEAWLSRDLGKTWQKGSAESKGQTLGVHLPGEGLFGVALQPAGTDRAPKGTDAADLWIEVDLTKPTAQITNVKVAHEKGQAQVDIQWTAEDKNFSVGPVDLFYAATQQGPWLPIAKGLPAQGHHRWAPSAEIGTHVHVRLIAQDAAGNQGICNTLESVALEDAGRPRFTIRNVRTEAPMVPQQAAPTPAPTPVPLIPPFQIVQPPRSN